MEPAQDRRRDDSIPGRQPVIVRRRHGFRRRIRQPRAQLTVRSAAIVMRDPELKSPSEMLLIDGNHKIQTLAADGPL